MCIGCWYGFAADLGALLGFAAKTHRRSGNRRGHFFTPEYIWFDIYYAAATALFAFAWHRLQPHAWAVWSIIGSSFLIFLAYTSVQVSVVINAWYGPFYNDIQKALTGDQALPRRYLRAFADFLLDRLSLYRPDYFPEFLHLAFYLPLAHGHERLFHGPMGARASH